MMYSHATCELFTVGASPDIYRVNLEQGRFLKPWQSCSSSVNVCHSSILLCLPSSSNLCDRN